MITCCNKLWIKCTKTINPKNNLDNGYYLTAILHKLKLPRFQASDRFQYYFIFKLSAVLVWTFKEDFQSVLHSLNTLSSHLMEWESMLFSCYRLQPPCPSWSGMPMLMLTPETYGGIVRDLLTFVADFWLGTGALDRFLHFRGKIQGECNIATILKMKDSDRVEWLPKWRWRNRQVSLTFLW